MLPPRVARAVVLLLVAARIAVCAPTVARQLQSQLPPVARVGHAYAFTIAPSTFRTTAANATLVYAIADLPAWAAFDAEQLAVRGTPGENDVATTQVTLSASEVGSESDTAQSSFRLIVTDTPTPTAHVPLAEQLAPSNASAFANTSAVLSSAFPLPRTPGVRIPPGWSFSLGLAPYTCTGAGRVYYGATLASGDALPKWLRFSSQSLTFSGATPRGAPLQSFDVRFVCSDFPDSAGVEQVFAFVVAEEAHALELRAPLVEIATVAHGSVRADVEAACLAALYLDGSPAMDANIAKVDVQVPQSLAWLTWNSADNVLVGDTPSSTDLLAGLPDAINVTVAVESVFGSAATLALPVRVYPFLFKDKILPSITPARGRSEPTVTLPIADLLAQPDALPQTGVISVSLDPAEAGTWLHFDSATLNLEGVVPAGVSYPAVRVTLSARHVTWPASAASTASFQIDELLDPSLPPDNGLSLAGDKSVSARRRAVIAMAVLIPILVLLVFALVFFCRRRQASAGKQPKRSGKPQIPVISITASRSWPNIRPGLFGGQRASASSDTKKLSISCHSQISHTSSWIVGTSIHDGQISVLSPRDGLTLGSFEAISLTQIGSRQPTPKELSPQIKELAPPAPHSGRSTPRRLALVRALDPELSDEIKTRRTSEDLTEIEFASPTRSDFDATSGSSSVASYKWTSPSSSDGDGEDATDHTLASQRSIPHPRPDFRPPPDGPRLYVRARAEAEVQRAGADAIGRSQQTIQLPGAAFGSHGDFAISDDSSSEDDDGDVSCIRVASLVPVGTPTPVREVAVGQAQLEDTPDAARERSQRTETPTRARPPASSADRALFGLGYSLGALVTEPAAPGIRLVSPPASPTRATAREGASSSPKDAPQVVRAKVGQRFHFHPQLNPPPPMTPSSGRSSPSRSRYVATCDDEAHSKLPAWLRWDEEEFAFWGVPGANDIASVQVRVVEHIARRTRDVVVGRVLVVVVKN
ncbi:hypothetical protein AURDEDRAFT_188981 [Auricularia subglabra TFB-10046 SS5]|uniref:Dystroglycan-type cadherin-like domain-containing protein n=1 Tax=Auricularia subglabra (strain TFB-10046 / SS5) TaxID=717982 RepID=J0WQ47_AURST|nr:hypothetical protein AURDEDRAFT_188981 [Auricularia subglabra TFB-10046 SS5]